MAQLSFGKLLHNRKSGRGFSLVELTLALLIAVVVISAVWATAEQVREGYQVTRTTQQIVKFVQNVREYYMSSEKLSYGGAVLAPGNYITTDMDLLNLFPAEMRRNPSAGPGGGPIDHPFNNSAAFGGVGVANGSFLVMSENCPSGTVLTSTCFAVRLMDLEPSACIRLLQALPIDDADLGVIRVGTQNFAGGTSTAVVTSPIGASTAQTWCNKAGANNEVDWMFKLHM